MSKVIWMNVYKDWVGGQRPSKEGADQSADLPDSRIGCIKITFTEAGVPVMEYITMPKPIEMWQPVSSWHNGVVVPAGTTKPSIAEVYEQAGDKGRLLGYFYTRTLYGVLEECKYIPLEET